MADDRQYQGGKRRPAVEKQQGSAKLPPATPLSEEERTRIQETIELSKEKLPGLREFVKDLVDAGLIHGWRNVNIKAR